LSFRQELAWLKLRLMFSKLQSRGSASRTTVPVLFMTVTCNKTTLVNVELLSNLKFHVANIFWPPPPRMQHRSVTFDTCHSIRPLAVIQPCLKQLTSANDAGDFVVHSNRCMKIEGICSKLSLLLDTNDLHLVDAASLVGTLTPEQKADHIEAFVIRIQTSIQESCLRPPVLQMLALTQHEPWAFSAWISP
jgi:hypothetical protein